MQMFSANDYTERQNLDNVIMKFNISINIHVNAKQLKAKRFGEDLKGFGRLNTNTIITIHYNNIR